MNDKAIGAAEQAANEVEEDVVELQLEIDELDVVAGGALGSRVDCYYESVCPRE